MAGSGPPPRKQGRGCASQRLAHSDALQPAGHRPAQVGVGRDVEHFEDWERSGRAPRHRDGACGQTRQPEGSLQSSNDRAPLQCCKPLNKFGTRCGRHRDALPVKLFSMKYLQHIASETGRGRKCHWPFGRARGKAASCGSLLPIRLPRTCSAPLFPPLTSPARAQPRHPRLHAQSTHAMTLAGSHVLYVLQHGMLEILERPPDGPRRRQAARQTVLVQQPASRGPPAEGAAPWGPRRLCSCTSPGTLLTKRQAHIRARGPTQGCADQARPLCRPAGTRPAHSLRRFGHAPGAAQPAGMVPVSWFQPKSLCV